MDDSSLEGQLDAAWKQVGALCKESNGALGPPGLVAHELALLRSSIESARASGDPLRLERVLAATKLFLARLKLLARLSLDEETKETRAR